MLEQNRRFMKDDTYQVILDLLGSNGDMKEPDQYSV
jgi:hypothetical protein